jgi:hypothetical protein
MIAGREGIAIDIIIFSYEIHMRNILGVFFIS